LQVGTQHDAHDSLPSARHTMRTEYAAVTFFGQTLSELTAKKLKSLGDVFLTYTQCQAVDFNPQAVGSGT